MIKKCLKLIKWLRDTEMSTRAYVSMHCCSQVVEKHEIMLVKNLKVKRILTRHFGTSPLKSSSPLLLSFAHKRFTFPLV